MSTFDLMDRASKIILWGIGIFIVICCLCPLSDPNFETRDMKLMRVNTELKEQKIRTLKQIEKGCTCFKGRKDKP